MTKSKVASRKPKRPVRKAAKAARKASKAARKRSNPARKRSKTARFRANASFADKVRKASKTAYNHRGKIAAGALSAGALYTMGPTLADIAGVELELGIDNALWDRDARLQKESKYRHSIETELRDKHGVAMRVTAKNVDEAEKKLNELNATYKGNASFYGQASSGAARYYDVLRKRSKQARDAAERSARAAAQLAYKRRYELAAAAAAAAAAAGGVALNHHLRKAPKGAAPAPVIFADVPPPAMFASPPTAPKDYEGAPPVPSDMQFSSEPVLPPAMFAETPAPSPQALRAAIDMFKASEHYDPEDEVFDEPEGWEVTPGATEYIDDTPEADWSDDDE